jgi:hypothetical protein
LDEGIGRERGVVALPFGPNCQAGKHSEIRLIVSHLSTPNCRREASRATSSFCSRSHSCSVRQRPFRANNDLGGEEEGSSEKPRLEVSSRDGRIRLVGLFEAGEQDEEVRNEVRWNEMDEGRGSSVTEVGICEGLGRRGAESSERPVVV